MLRHFTHGLSYRDPDRVVVLAQGSPFFGIRLGFRDRETEVFRTRSQLARRRGHLYVDQHRVPVAARPPRNRSPPKSGPQFFNVLGVGPSPRQGLNGPETFLASYDFWKSQLGASPAAVGQSFEIGGRSLRLTGIMPRSFSFLSTPIAVWIDAGPEPPVDRRRWHLALRGAVARLRPGVSQDAAEKELRQLLVDAQPRSPAISTSAPRPSAIWCTGPLARMRWICYEHFADPAVGRLQYFPRPQVRDLLAHDGPLLGLLRC